MGGIPRDAHRLIKIHVANHLSAPLWFYRVGKKPSAKADLAIFSPVLGTSGHLPLGHRQWSRVFSKGQVQAQSTQ